MIKENIELKEHIKFFNENNLVVFPCENKRPKIKFKDIEAQLLILNLIFFLKLMPSFKLIKNYSVEYLKIVFSTPNSSRLLNQLINNSLND